VKGVGETNEDKELFIAVKGITAQEAHELMCQGAGCVYIDVRTVAEFAAGHPQDAVNIPVAFPDPTRGMAINQDFVPVVEAHFPKESKIILGCQAGPRSDAAAKLLQQAGYQEIYSMQGGYGGMRDPFGRVIAPGWVGLGLPVSQENGVAVSYESLAAKVR